MKVTVVGVRHHSPACAALVASVLEEVRPRTVLIEGPADFNPRLDELQLDHELPLAIYSYYQEGLGRSTRASWSPFCDYSPEWVALRKGRVLGAQVLFMDLPAWTRPFWGVSNRYADRPGLGYVEELGRRLSCQGLDALWDHLFEQPLPKEELSARLEAYFEAVRESEPAQDSDLEREDFMARYLAWAAREGPVVAVCGGYHKPRLEKIWPEVEPTLPALPNTEAGVRHGSYLVPYSFRRLDSFTGYASGMPSPAFYQAVWEQGPQEAGQRVTRWVAERLRKLKQPVSAADLVAARTMTEGLMRLRGHLAPARGDLLDGFASALVKEALETALPWEGRGLLAAGTHPVLVELVAAFSGERKGRLDERTPLPPLVADLDRLLEDYQLRPARPARRVEAPLGTEQSHLLHRLRLLEIPGFQRRSDEEWWLSMSPEFESAAIEAGAWGATVEQASRARLRELLGGVDGQLDLVAMLLIEAVQADLTDLSDELLAEVEGQVGREVDFSRLGAALGSIALLWRRNQEERFATLLGFMQDRGLWLFEALQGPTLPADPGMIAGVQALRDLNRFLPEAPLEIALPVMERKALDQQAPPAARGAALGYLWSFKESQTLEEQSLKSIRGSSRPSELGDFLAGLFGVAREEVVRLPNLIQAVDQMVSGFDDRDFLVAAPSLRMAFSYFPPRERESVARTLLRLHGGDAGQAWGMVHLKTSPDQLMRGHRLEQRVTQLMESLGLA